jgi:hypothetical protein
MQAEVQTDEELLLDELIEQVNGAGNEAAARNAYRDGFDRLRSELLMYPLSGTRSSVTFESAAKTARIVAARCLPLAIAIAMHLYPLCALQCIPLPWMSAARFKRAVLLRTIRDRSLILANTGSERTRSAAPPLIATRSTDGIRIDGTCEYMSLASVADVVFFEAKLADSDCAVLCAADLKAESVRIGGWKFGGSMRLSDTSSATFVSHRVPLGRYLIAPDDSGLQCVADYQRCWFHLFLAEINVARLEVLHRVWRLPQSAERVVSLNEASRLREYSLRLLDSFSSSADLEPLVNTTSALKLRVSLMAQSIVAALRSRETRTSAEAQRLAADAAELCYIKSQPTADETILRRLGWTGH